MIRLGVLGACMGEAGIRERRGSGKGNKVEIRSKKRSKGCVGGD